MRLIKLLILSLVLGSPLFAADYLLHDWNSGSGTTWSATNAAKGSAVTITDDKLNAAQWDYMVTDWSSAVTITNAAAGEMAELNLERTTADDVDDYGQDVGVAFIEIRYVKNPTR